MKHDPIRRVPFIAKGPADRHDLGRILALADRLSARGTRPAQAEGESPPNVIPFPTRRENFARSGNKLRQPGSQGG